MLPPAVVLPGLVTAVAAALALGAPQRLRRQVRYLAAPAASRAASPAASRARGSGWRRPRPPGGRRPA
jgi:hypothetical protein